MLSKKETGDLRTRAEALITARSSGAPADTLPYNEVLRQLLVHQIAIEMQNEEFRRAQDIIEESRTRYVDLYEFAPVAYLTFDETGRVIEANLTVCGLLGIDRRSLIGKFFSPFVTPDDGDTFLKHRFEVLKNRVKQRCELNLERADGSRFYGSVESIEAKSTQGPTVRSALTDISERKRVEQERDLLERLVREGTAELQRAGDKLAEEKKEREAIKAQLRQAQKMDALGALSGGIAHGFNNILATIIGFTELTRDHLPQKSREIHHLDRVIEAGLRGRELTKQLLTFARKTEQNKKPLQLGGIVREAVELLRASIPTSISIRADLKNETGMILADPVQMRQVLMNLCTNAVCAMQEKGGILDIGLNDYIAPPTNGATGMKPGPYMKLSVRDTGNGIASEIMDKVFDPFFTTKGPGEGSGLGLSVVHDIIAQSHGYIVVKSEPGTGTVFTTFFPEAGEEHAGDAAGDDAVPSGHERILFVDDEEGLAEMAGEMLTELGYSVVSRTAGREALALLKEDPSRFDVVITDQTMSEMTGVELAREVLALRADMPIIMCTGFSYVVNEDKAKAAGIKAFAMKPLTKREIAKTIRKVLDEHTAA